MLHRSLLALAAMFLGSSPSSAGDVFSYPPTTTPGLLTSSWVAPDGYDADMYAYNDFILPATEAITEVRWRGGYTYNAPYGKAYQFTITFFATNITGSEPLIVTLPDVEGEPSLANYQITNNAGETPAGTVGGLTVYDYKAVLPTPFVATGGVKYWIRIEAWQPSLPDWGLVRGSGGNNYHFRYSTGLHMFQNIPGDTAFTLKAAWKDLGFAKPGSNGTPTLVGTGSFHATESGTLTLSSAKKNSTAFGIVGASTLNVPFFGGTLVPAPDILFTLPTGSSGKITLPFALPAGVPPGVTIYAQFWIADSGAPQGYAASNALRATTD